MTPTQLKNAFNTVCDAAEVQLDTLAAGMTLTAQQGEEKEWESEMRQVRKLGQALKTVRESAEAISNGKPAAKKAAKADDEQEAA